MTLAVVLGTVVGIVMLWSGMSRESLTRVVIATVIFLVCLAGTCWM